jgi:hypothetical protein
MFGGGMQNAWKLFEGNSNAATTIEGAWCESFTWLGNFGVQVAGLCPVNFTSDHFTLGTNGSGSNYEPYWFTSSAPLKFDSCDFNCENLLYVLNYFNSSTTTFINNDLFSIPAGVNPFLGVSDYAAGLSLIGYKFINNVTAQAANNNPICINNQFVAVSGELPPRQAVSPWTNDIKLLGTTGYTSYHVVLPFGGYMGGTQDFSSPLSITGTGHNAVLTFTAGWYPEWQVGNMIMWNVPDRSGTITNVQIPAFKVTNVNTGTGVVTAQSLFDNINTAWSPNHLYKPLPLFFNGTVATGNTHSNMTIDNVTNVSNFAVGDYIQGPGIGINTCITAISGTTLTTSRSASATANGVNICNCGLVAY